MTSRIDIIKDGYSRWLSPHTMAADGTAVLIRANGLTVMFDTCGPWARQQIIDKLASYGLHCDDIDRLVCSHGHTDHIGNINLFVNCGHIVGDHIYRQDIYELTAFKQSSTLKLSNDMQIVLTPGHTLDSTSLVVSNVDKLGTVALVGDLFECEADLLDESIWIGAGSQDQQLQRQNRQRMLSVADYVVPGHGPIFRTADHRSTSKAK